MFRKVFLSVGLGFIGKLIREVAEGKHGETLKALYWKLAGIKTWTGLALALITVGLLAASHEDLAAIVTGSVATLLISAGLLDKAWRARPPALETRRWWVLLRGWWPEIAVVLAGVAAKLTGCTPELAAQLARIHLTCGTALVIVTVVTAIGGWALGETRLATAPKEITR